MHQDRFYISYSPTNSEIWLNGKEAHHILHVKRAKIGTKITLFDGKGSEYTANITEIFNDKLKVSIEQSQAIDREAPIDITIAFSIPKGKLVNLLVQKCTELGVKTLIPLHCDRSVVDIRNKSEEKVEKWDKVAIEASKQCKRNYITKIEHVMPFDELIKTASSYDLSIIACTTSDTISLKNVLNEHASAKKIICIIGPEGGFTQREISLSKNTGCIPVSLGASILRVETAAIAIASILLYNYSNYNID